MPYEKKEIVWFAYLIVELCQNNIGQGKIKNF